MYKEYIKHHGWWQQGPCIGCGREGYGISMGGPKICPRCDLGKPAKQYTKEEIEFDHEFHKRLYEDIFEDEKVD